MSLAHLVVGVVLYLLLAAMFPFASESWIIFIVILSMLHEEEE